MWSSVTVILVCNFLVFFLNICRWFELDPQELLDSVKECLEEVGRKCVALKQIKGIGITNQRETTILWDRTTGLHLHNAIGV